MDVEMLQPGDVVYAAEEIRNDGGIPDLAPEALIAAAGARGVIVQRGHLEEQPDALLFLVRFEDAALNLGPPVGCWPEELRVQA